MCAVKSPDCANVFVHHLHSYGFSPVCVPATKLTDENDSLEFSYGIGHTQMNIEMSFPRKSAPTQTAQI